MTIYVKMQVDDNFQFLVENGLINDYESSFWRAFHLKRENDSPKLMNVLLTKAYRYLNDLSPKFENEGFYLRQNNLCSINIFVNNTFY